MFSPRYLLVPALLALCAAGAQGQPRKDDALDFRRLLTPPKTTPEFWEALVFELEVGRPDLAAAHLRTLVSRKPTPDELVELHRKEGIAAFLRLRLVPKWSEDRTREKQARDDVESLIDMITQAVRANLTNPLRIRAFVNNLYGLPEENAFARIELTKSGAAAVPYLIDEMLRRPEADRLPIMEALSVMGHDAMQPLLAALDINDNVLRENLLEVLKRRRDLFLLPGKGVDVAAAVWPLAALNPSAAVKRRAREVLAVVYDVRSPDHLPLPINELTALAERYYYHRVRFADPNKVSLWRWDGKKLLEETMTASKVEELLGLRYARQALQINPTHQPAQVIMLSLLVDKGHQAPSADHPLGVLRPTVEDLLLTLNADLLNATLEQALRDERTTVIVSTLRALGKLGDARALKPQAQGEPAVVRALYFGDPRVNFAAADALLRIPGAGTTAANARIVQVLKAALLPEPVAAARPRVLVASAQERLLLDLRRAAEGAGYDPVMVASGRQALRRLLERTDVGAVVIDSTLPDPGLSSLLAQLRADPALKRLPVLVAAVPDGPETRLVLEQLEDVRIKLHSVEEELQPRLEEQARLAGTATLQPRAGSAEIIRDLRKRKAELEDRLVRLSERYEATATQREAALRRHYEKLKHVWVVSPSALREARLLAARLEERVREAGMPPLSKAERKEQLETALSWLAKLAAGEPAGFDVRPVEDALIALMPGLSDANLINGLRVLGRIPGGKAQRQLITVLLDQKAKVPARVAAADELRRHMQEFGLPDVVQQRELLTAIETELKQPGIDAALRDRFTRFVGGLRPGEKSTGQRLRDFPP